MKRILSSFGIAAVTIGLVFAGFGCEYGVREGQDDKDRERVSEKNTTIEGTKDTEDNEVIKALEQKVTDLQTQIANPPPDKASEEALKAIQDQNALLTQLLEEMKKNPPTVEEPPAETPPPGPSGKDTTAPGVKAVFPGKNMSSLSPGMTLAAVTFTEPVDPASVTKDSLTFTGVTTAGRSPLKRKIDIVALLEGTAYASGSKDSEPGAETAPPTVISVDSSANPTFAFTFNPPLAAGKQYSLKLHSGTKDTAGNAMADDYTWSFKTTKEAAAPKPADDEKKPAAPATDTPAAKDPKIVSVTRSGNCHLYEGDGDTDCEVEDMAVTYTVAVENVTKVTVNCDSLSQNDFNPLSTTQSKPVTMTGKVYQSWSGEQDSVTLNCTISVEGALGTTPDTTGVMASHCDDNVDCDACDDCDYIGHPIDNDGNQGACTSALSHTDCDG